MTARRRSAALAVLAGLAIAVSGCGGAGGGGAADEAGAGAGAITTPPAVGVPTVPTDALFGTPEAVDTARAAGSLEGYDEFGTPRDAFVPIVRDGSSSAAPSSSEPGTGQVAAPTSTPPPTATTPVVPGVPSVPGGVPGVPGGVPGGAPGAGTPGAGSTPGSTTPTTAPPPAAPAEAPPVTGYEADFDIGGEPVVARVGDAVPPDTQQFTVTTITADGVVLTLNGGLLPDGSDTVRLAEGKSLTLINQTSRRTYRLRLLDVRKV